jgi:hypothetical protein
LLIDNRQHILCLDDSRRHSRWRSRENMLHSRSLADRRTTCHSCVR